MSRQLSSPFVVDPQTGLASFPSLTAAGVPNAVTYEGKIWGNMNPYFSKSDKETEAIIKKDWEVSEMLGVKDCFVLTTPPEDTIICITSASRDYLLDRTEPDEKGYRYVTVRANAVIIQEGVEKSEYVAAPADCPVLLFRHPMWRGSVLIHLGAPQVIEGLHLKVMAFLKGLEKDLKTADFEVYATPYICPEHFSLTVEDYNSCMKSWGSAAQRDRFFVKRDHDVYATGRYFFDFLGLAKEQLREEYGVVKWVESGRCTYEEALEGNLFSHELSLQQEHRVKSGEKVDAGRYKGSYNVAFVV